MLTRIFLLFFMFFAPRRSQQVFHSFEPVEFRQVNGIRENNNDTQGSGNSLVSIYSSNGGNVLRFDVNFMRHTYPVVLVKTALPSSISNTSEVRVYDNETIIHNTSEFNFNFYIGRVINSPGSVVQGTVDNGVFVGSMETMHKTFYIERYDRYFNDSLYNAFIYEPEDVSVQYCHDRDCDNLLSKSRYVRHSKRSNNHGSAIDTPDEDVVAEPRIQLQEAREPRTNDKTPQYGFGKVCEILAVSDHTYFEFQMRTLSNVITEMTRIVTAVSREFEKVDFDGDGKPDKITLPYATTEIYRRPTGRHGSHLYDDLSQEELLFAFSRLQWRNRFCLAILFTARDFHPKAGPGLAFTAVSNPRGPDGGICSPVAKYSSPISGRARLNTLLISAVHNGKGVPFSTMVTNLLHQVGHSFGSYHDPLSELSCLPNNELGDFIMNPELLQEEMPNKRTFSSCSILRMLPVIRNKGSCLMDKTSVPSERWQDKCGNGIVEDDEECDCGVETSCVALDPCCGPMGGMSPCRLIPGASCSPAIDACCSHHCTFREQGESCAAASDHECSSYGICSGGKGCVHVLPAVRDSEKCSNDQGTCFGGICQSNVCSDNQFLTCKCDFPAEQRCHVCCQIGVNGTCKSAFDLGIKDPTGEPFKQPLGWSCYNDMGICNRKGMCEMVVKKTVTDRVLFGYQRVSVQTDSGWFLNHLCYLLTALILIPFLLVCVLGVIRHWRPSNQLSHFRAACMESKKRIKEGGDDWDELFGRSRLDAWSKECIIRLYALFPHASALQIIQASEESSEQGAVQSLLAQGVPIRSNFQVPWPAESLVGPPKP